MSELVTCRRPKAISLWLLLFITLILLTTGCSLFRPASLADLTLPNPDQLDCCWQAQELVQIELPNESATKDQPAQRQLQAAVLRSEGQLTVVILDPLGRRLVTLQQNQQGVQTIVPASSDTASPAVFQWDERLSKQLLLAVYLHQLAPERWQLQQAGWQLLQSETGQSRILAHRGDTHMQLDYLPTTASNPSIEHQRRQISIQRPNVRLIISTVARTGL